MSMSRSLLVVLFGSSLIAAACGGDESASSGAGGSNEGGSNEGGSGGETTTTTSSASGGANQGGSAQGGAGGMGQGGSAQGGAGQGGSAQGGAGGMGQGGAGGMGQGGAAPSDPEVAFFGDFATNGSFELGLATYPGPTTSVVALDGLTGKADLRSIAYSPDGTKLAVAARDLMTSTMVLNVYAADGSGTATTIVTAANTTQVIDKLAWSADSALLAFLHDGDVNGSMGLYVVPGDGSTAAKRLSPSSNNANRDVTSFAWSPDVSGTARTIAFVADFATNDEFVLSAVDAAAAMPAPLELVSSATTVAGGDVQDLLAFDADGLVYFKSDWETDQLFELYRASVDGTTLEVVPGTALMNGNIPALVGSFGMSADGSTIAFTADSVTTDVYDVFVLDLATTMAMRVSDTGASVPATGFSGPNFEAALVFSPDGSTIAAVADYQLAQGELDNAYSLWVFPTTGMGGSRLVANATNAAQDARNPAFSLDSSRLFFLADYAVATDVGLYSTDDLATASQDPATLLVQSVPAGGDVVGLVVRK